MLASTIFLFSCSGSRPTNLGLNKGNLTPCPDSPNCVSSQSQDKHHYVAPLSYEGELANAKEKLLSVLTSMKRVNIVTNEATYIHAEFTSALFRFVDDVEFFCDDATKTIHVRSASRVGYSDLGVNRKRVEEIRTRFIERK